MLKARPVSNVCRMSAAVCILAVATAIGCSKGGYSGPTGTVTGKVTVGGQPAPAGALVSFMSDKGHAASGQVGPGGAYTVLYGGKSDIPAETYKVAVSAASQPAMSEADYEKMMATGGTPPPAPKSPIPEKFANPSTSGLSYEVKAGANTIDIELK